jgi:hypothetical protein
VVKRESRPVKGVVASGRRGSRRYAVRKTKVVLLNIVSVVTIASLVTGCCGGLEGIGPALDYDESASQTVTPTPVPDQEDVPAAYVAGEYLIQHIEQTKRSTRVTYPHQTFSDFTAEVDVRFADDVDFTLGGLLFRWQDDDNHYGFLVWNNGQYGLFKRVDGEVEELVNESSPYLNSGVATNRLKAVVAGDSIDLYVNDEHVTRVTDSSLQEGRLGLHATVHSESPVSTEVYFDNLRVSGPEEASTTLFEDDFSDPSSGWPIEEYAYGSVGYRAAASAEEAVEIFPTPTPEALEPVELVSERELTTEEFFQRVEGDEGFEDVYALAEEQGYTEPRVAREFTASDGSVTEIILLASPTDQPVIAFRIDRGQTSTSLLLRAEDDGETVVLYDRHGRAEMTVLDEETVDVRVFDAAGNPIGASEFRESSRSAGLASAQRQLFGDPFSWYDFEHCLQRWSGGVRRTSAQLVEALGVLGIAVTSAATTLSAGGAAVLAAAFVLGVEVVIVQHCLGEASVDHPPSAAPESRRKIGTCRTVCSEAAAGVHLVCEQPKYRIEFALDDDRGPVEGPDYLEVCAGDTGTLTVRDTRGRGPQTTTVEYTAPSIDQETDCTRCTSDRPYCSPDLLKCVECRSDADDCPTGQTCVDGACAQAALSIDIFEADPSSITSVECARLYWRIYGEATGVFLDGEVVPAAGSLEVCPDQSTTYVLRAEGPAGIEEQSIRISVTDAEQPPEREGGFDRVGRGEFFILTWPDQGLTVHTNEIRLGFPGEGGAVYGTAHLQQTSFENVKNPRRPADLTNLYLTFRGTFTPPANLSGTYEARLSGIDVKYDDDTGLFVEEPIDEWWVDQWEGTLQDDGTLRIVRWWGNERFVHDLTVSGGVWTQQQLTVP